MEGGKLYMSQSWMRTTGLYMLLENVSQHGGYIVIHEPLLSPWHTSTGSRLYEYLRSTMSTDCCVGKAQLEDLLIGSYLCHKDKQ